MEQGHFIIRRSSTGDCYRNSIDIQQSFMTPADATQTQKPYRYGMILLCFGALINWVGLAENYTEPIRYAGVACIVGGALLICTAMCCWLQSPNRVGSGNVESDDPIHIIAPACMARNEKPPEYETVVIEPPNYDDAIKLDPMALLHAGHLRIDEDSNTVPSYDCATSSPSPSSSAMLLRNNVSDSLTIASPATTISVVQETPSLTTQDKPDVRR